MKKRDCRANYARNDKLCLIAAPQKAQLEIIDPPTLPLPSGERIKVKGFTLIEVVLAVVVITIAVSATLVVMAKMMSYTANRGQAVDISNAITISQMAIDRVRDQRFPPTTEIGDLSEIPNGSMTISNTIYTYKTDIVAYDPDAANKQNPIGTLAGVGTEYYNVANGDVIQGYRNLLKITVTVSKNGRQILKTVTYKTRNGYY